MNNVLIIIVVEMHSNRWSGYDSFWTNFYAQHKIMKIIQKHLTRFGCVIHRYYCKVNLSSRIAYRSMRWLFHSGIQVNSSITLYLCVINWINVMQQMSLKQVSNMLTKCTILKYEQFSVEHFVCVCVHSFNQWTESSCFFPLSLFIYLSLSLPISLPIYST